MIVRVDVGGLSVQLGRLQFFTHLSSPTWPHLCRWKAKRSGAGRILFDYDLNLGLATLRLWKKGTCDDE